MKVLHVIPSVAAVRGGPSQAGLEMVAALRQAGVDAEIATTNDNGANLLEVPLHQRVDYGGVPIWFFPRYSPPLHPLREFAISGSLTQWLWRSLPTYDWVHVHALFSYPSTVAMAIARHHRVPYIVRPLGQLGTWAWQQKAWKKRIYWQGIERANLNGSQGIHFTSELEQQEASPLQLTSPGFVLPHGVPVPVPNPSAYQQLRRRLNLPEDEPIVLFLSRLHPKKGLDYSIAALQSLSHHRFTFVLAGQGEASYEAEIDRLLSLHGLSHRTRRPGFVSGEFKQLLLQGSDLFILTSQAENFGIAVLEALAAGLPVLVTPGVALADWIQEHQLGYVPSLEIEAIAAALQQWWEDRRDAQSMANRRDRTRLLTRHHFSWEAIAARLHHHYQIGFSSHTRLNTLFADECKSFPG